MFAQCVDASGESASRFSVLATNAAVTNILAPGGPTGTFPTPGTFVICGTGGSNASTTGSNLWHGSNQGAQYGNFQIAVANCIGTSGISEDGTWNLIFGHSGNATPGSCTIVGWNFCENSEDGDVDPYVVIAPVNSGAYLGSRTVLTIWFNSTVDYCHNSVLNSTSTHGSAVPPI